tara:strand:- start:142 stop:438 length:297 start_codon:yes stop_codon:yes gene_type:complete
MYSLTGTPLASIVTPPSISQKYPVLSDVKTDSIYQSSQNDPIPEINSNIKSVKPSSSKMTEYMDSNVENLLKEQIFLMKFILLFLGFMLLSNILAKKN